MASPDYRTNKTNALQQAAAHFLSLRQDKATYVSVIPRDIVEMICPFVSTPNFALLGSRVHEVRNPEEGYKSRRELDYEREELLCHLELLEELKIPEYLNTAYEEIKNCTHDHLGPPNKPLYTYFQSHLVKTDLLTDSEKYKHFLGTLRDVVQSTQHLMNRSINSEDPLMKCFGSKLVLKFYYNPLNTLSSLIPQEIEKTAMHLGEKVPMNPELICSMLNIMDVLPKS